MRSLTHNTRRQPLITLIVTALLAGAFGLLTALPAQAGTAPTPAEQDAFNLINHYRAQNGVPLVALSPGLQSASHDYAAYNASRLTNAHDTSANLQASCAAAANGGTYQPCSELIGRASGSTPMNVIESFKLSSTHWNVLMDPQRTHVGVGAARGSDNRWYVVVRIMHAPGAPTADPTTTTTTRPTTTTTQPTTQPTTTTTTAPSQTFTSAQKFVKSVYADFLSRQPTSAELADWSSRVATQAQREAFIRTHAYSNEYIGVLIDRYYQVALGRPADAAGKAYWADIIRRRVLTPAQVGAHFYASEEYFQRSGSSLHNWVNDLYIQLLGRTADTAGRNHWVSVAQTRGRQVVAINFYNSRESLNVRVDTLYRQLLGRPSDPGGRQHWGDVIFASGNDVDLGVFLAGSAEYMTRSQSRY